MDSATAQDIALVFDQFLTLQAIYSFIGPFAALVVYDALISFFSFLRNKLSFAPDEINKDQD